MIDDHPFISPIFLGLLEHFRESVNIEFYPLPVSINTPRNFHVLWTRYSTMHCEYCSSEMALIDSRVKLKIDLSFKG